MAKSTRSDSTVDADTASETPDTELAAVDVPAAEEEIPSENSAEDMTQDSKTNGVETNDESGTPPAFDSETVPENDDVVETASEDEAAHSDIDTEGEEETDADDLPETADLDAEYKTEEPTSEEAEDSLSSAEDAPSTEPTSVATAGTSRSSGFLPLLLGGIIAGGIGYGAATYQNAGFGAPKEDPFKAQVTGELSTQTEATKALTTRVTAVETALKAIDLSPLQSSIDDTAKSLKTTQAEIAKISAEVTKISSTVSGFESRITALEKKPMADAVSPETVAAYEKELADLRKVVEARKAEIEKLVASERTAIQASVAKQRAAIEAIAAAASKSEASAEDIANLATARNAMTLITTAVQTGEPYATPLAELVATKEVEVPAALSGPAKDGVASHDDLTQAFPDLSRAALLQVRKSSSEVDSIGNFFKTHLGARSVVPREGSDPDAVLSRAEAAIKTSDIATALKDLTALPDSVQPIFADWIASATARKDALAAAAQLAQDLNQK